MCARRPLTISYDRPTCDTRTAADVERTKQVVRNLLSNAVKFSPDGGEIHVKLRRVDESLLLTVRDEGPGIPADELEAVFDKFVQSSKTRTGGGGTGLGLSISREIVSGHSGRIWTEQGEEPGAIFFVQLPIRTICAEHPCEDACGGASGEFAVETDPEECVPA